MKKTKSIHHQFAIASAQERDLGVSVVPFPSADKMRFVHHQLGVRVGKQTFACLPDGVSAVFQLWNTGCNSVALPSALKKAQWPGDYGPAAWVRSVDVDEIFALANQDLPDERLVWLPPFHYEPSMSVGDIAAVNQGNFADVMRCDTVGWVPLELISGNYRFVGN